MFSGVDVVLLACMSVRCLYIYVLNFFCFVVVYLCVLRCVLYDENACVLINAVLSDGLLRVLLYRNVCGSVYFYIFYVHYYPTPVIMLLFFSASIRLIG